MDQTFSEKQQQQQQQQQQQKRRQQQQQQFSDLHCVGLYCHIKEQHITPHQMLGPL
jgi:hypothetical protein